MKFFILLALLFVSTSTANRPSHGKVLPTRYVKRDVPGMGRLYMCVGIPSPKTCHELEWKLEGE